MPVLPIESSESTSVEEVESCARALSSDIFSDWHQLNAILERHEATIHRRWAKKTKTQRTQILLAAWPRMPATHRPDFVAYRRETERQRAAGTKFRESYLWPNINLEDLCKPKVFPLFLQARARNMPDVFAKMDQSSMQLALVSNALTPIVLTGYVMMFNNRKKRECYGELLPVHDDKSDDERKLTGLQPGLGLLVLEVQQGVLRFLVACCKQLMHDVPSQRLLSNDFAVQSTVTLAETSESHASLAVMTAEAPYRPPGNLDIKRLESLFAARAEYFADHIWDMREDPGYFADTLFEFKEHQAEMIKDSGGRCDAAQWQRIIANVVGNSYFQLELWTDLHDQSRELLSLDSGPAASSSEGRNVSDEYLTALFRLRLYLSISTRIPLDLLRDYAPGSPPLRSYYFRDTTIDTSQDLGVRKRRGLKLDKSQYGLLWILEILQENGDRLQRIGLTNATDELERLIQSEPNARDMISAYIARTIGDVAVISEGLRQIHIYEPCMETFKDMVDDKVEGVKKDLDERTENWEVVVGVFDDCEVDFAELGQPSNNKFYYPDDKRRTKENLDAMRAAENHLDAFWAAIDENMRRKFGEKVNETALRRLLQSRTLRRTPEWVEPDVKELSRSADIGEIQRPLSELYFDVQSRTERTIDTQRQLNVLPKTKLKIRGVATHAPTIVEDLAPDAVQDLTKLAVDHRALGVLRSLFYTPTLTSTPGEIAWKDFLYAMVSTGFQLEQLYGSAWQFSPHKLDAKRSIQFHAPHPVGKIPYGNARRMGRRLERSYGWTSDTFVLARD